MDVSDYLLDIESIRKIIPHRYPFLLIDRVISLTEKEPGQLTGRQCLARKNVTANEPFFPGHFPSQSIMPGVLLLEALVQAGAVCAGGLPKDPPIKQLFFAGLDHVRFKKAVVPGDVLDLRVEIQRTKASFVWGHGTAAVEGKTAVKADFLAHVTFGPS